MKLWLKRSGESDFIGPLAINDIRQGLANGNLDWEYEALQATGQSLGALKRSSNWRPLADLCTPASVSASSGTHAPSKEENTNLTILHGVRSNTCYSALRSMIDLFTVLAIILVILAAGTYVVLGIKMQSTVAAFIGLVAGILGALVVIASKQASLLLVDIADLLVESRRLQKGNAEKAT